MSSWRKYWRRKNLISTESSLFKGLFKLVKSKTLINSTTHSWLTPLLHGWKQGLLNAENFAISLLTIRFSYTEHLLSSKNIIYRKFQKLYIFAKLNGLKLHIASIFSNPSIYMTFLVHLCDQKWSDLIVYSSIIVMWEKPLRDTCM